MKVLVLAALFAAPSCVRSAGAVPRLQWDVTGEYLYAVCTPQGKDCVVIKPTSNGKVAEVEIPPRYRDKKFALRYCFVTAPDKCGLLQVNNAG